MNSQKSNVLKRAIMLGVSSLALGIFSILKPSVAKADQLDCQTQYQQQNASCMTYPNPDDRNACVNDAYHFYQLCEIYAVEAAYPNICGPECGDEDDVDQQYGVMY